MKHKLICISLIALCMTVINYSNKQAHSWEVPKDFKSSEPKQGTKDYEYSGNSWEASTPSSDNNTVIRTKLTICQEKYQECINSVNYERAAGRSGGLSAVSDAAKYSECKVARDQCLKRLR